MVQIRLLLLFALLAIAVPLFGESAVIEGTITAGGSPLPGVTVQLGCDCDQCATNDCKCCPAAGPVVVTDAEGHFRFVVPGGAYRVEASLPGFKPGSARASVRDGGTFTLTIALKSDDVSIE